MNIDRNITSLLDGVLAGGMTRREALRRASLLGIGAPALAALVTRAELAVARQGVSPYASPSADGVPPIAEQIPSVRAFGGREIDDPYAWLENPDDPRVIAYLEAENAYTAQVLAPTREFQELLIDEFIARIPQTDSDVPTRIGDWFYYLRIEEGLDYSILARRDGSMDAPEEVLVDLNELADGYIFLGQWEPSPDHSLIAFLINESGGIDYTLNLLDTATGEITFDLVGLVDSFGWSTDGSTLIYTRPDDALRPYQVYAHALGTDPATDELLLTEDDEIFGLYLFTPNDGQHILVTSYAYGTTEAQFIDRAGPDFTPQMLAARREGIEVYPDHGAQGFLVLTNEDAIDFKLVAVPDENLGAEAWTDLIPPADGRLIDGFDVLQDYLGVYGRENGFSQVWIYHVADGSLAPVTFDEPVFTAGAGVNREYQATTLNITYTSLVTPWSTYEVDLATGELTLIKQDEVLDGHNPDDFVSERLLATADDGTQVPISLVYRKDRKLNGPMPLRLDGYGAYGINSDPVFSAFRLALINRGVIYAVAHIRGGSELGRHWYDDGKLLNKMNTFTDFIACARFLADEGLTSPGQILAYGGSAGGLLLGAVSNMAPEAFGTIVAEVPFVDVLRVMLDPTLPLTTGEYVEWGNPEEDEFYEYIGSYSPYDNVTAQNYPAFLITAGINDDQVPYWQPAKWTAKLRATKTDDNVLLLRTNLGAGHGGASARYEAYGEVAEMYAFMLMHLVPDEIQATPVADRRRSQQHRKTMQDLRQLKSSSSPATTQVRRVAGRHSARQFVA